MQEDFLDDFYTLIGVPSVLEANHVDSTNANIYQVNYILLLIF